MTLVFKDLIPRIDEQPQISLNSTRCSLKTQWIRLHLLLAVLILSNVVWKKSSKGGESEGRKT